MFQTLYLIVSRNIHKKINIEKVYKYKNIKIG